MATLSFIFSFRLWFCSQSTSRSELRNREVCDRIVNEGEKKLRQFKFLAARRVIVVWDAGARIFLWHVARPRPLPSPPAVLSGYEYRFATANAKPLAVVRLLFVHSVLRTDSLSNSSIRCTPRHEPPASPMPATVA